MSGWQIDVNYAPRPAGFSLAFKADWQARVTGIFGPSGSGKSTLLEILLGLRPRVAGRAALDGRVLFDSRTGCALAPEARCLAWVPQDGALFTHLTVAGNLQLTAARNPRVNFTDVVKILELETLLGALPADLSGGEKQRVALGRALLADRAALLLDEPLAAVDRPRRRQMLSYIERVVAALPISILYVTHEWDEILQLCEHVLLLDQGQLKYHGPPSASPCLVP